jgi:pantoate kinase
VYTSVEVQPAERRSIDISINGRRADASTTWRTVALLVGGRRLRVKVDSRMALPVAQGLGMSAAGALSTALALGQALGRPVTHLDAGRAAHVAEIMERTGLGDVAAQLCGGWELRVRAGFPPFGQVDRFLVPPRDVAVCVSGRPVPTRSVLTDRDSRKRISALGRRCMRRILEKPTLANFFGLSFEFASGTGLADEGALALAREVGERGLGMASVSMIGNSVFAVGKADGLVKLMRPHGEVFLCRTATCGAGPVV